MNLSYWEIKNWIKNIDYTIVGSGIVGLTCALQLRKRFPKASILVLEKGILPQGASTKNAGFACFGSLSEILNDLKTHTEEEVLQLVTQRIKGLNLLRKRLGDKTIDYHCYGGYELFLNEDQALLESCLSEKENINKLLSTVFKDPVFNVRINNLGFKGVKDILLYNPYEAQIDSGKMMMALLRKVQLQNIKILNATTVEAFTEGLDAVKVKTNHFEFSTSKLLIANNGFASKLLAIDVKPARGQVLITKPIKDLPIKGTFHFDKGYYYFRNIDNRILLGGGRHLDFKTENTTDFAQTDRIQKKLETLLRTMILPKSSLEIEYRWSGIMGMGSQSLSGYKKPIVKQLSNNVYCGVRLSGMGIAIGSLIGKELANTL